MNIVIPMVGMGKRFSDVGYTMPKPLIEVNGIPIIQHAIESLNLDGRYIFIIRKNEFSDILKSLLIDLKRDCEILEVDYLTDGTVNSILLSQNLINNSQELITTNCDQRTEWDSKAFINFTKNNEMDGCVATYPYDNIVLGQKSPYSFIKLNSNNIAIQLEEKLAISNLALCGIHYWRKGSDFVNSALELIKNNDRINGEFYVSKTYNYLIKDGKKIKHYPLKEGDFFSLGTPKDIEVYQKLKNENR